MNVREFVRLFAFAGLTTCLSIGSLWGQSDCTYDECGLRIRYRAFAGIDVVQGRDSDRVAGYSFFGLAPQLPMLAEGVDSVRVNYQAFRAGNNSGVLLQMLGLAAMAGGYVALMADGSDDLAIGLTLGGIIPFAWGTFRRTTAQDRLSRSIWWYNRALR